MTLPTWGSSPRDPFAIKQFILTPVPIHPSPRGILPPSSGGVWHGPAGGRDRQGKIALLSHFVVVLRTNLGDRMKNAA